MQELTDEEILRRTYDEAIQSGLHGLIRKLVEIYGSEIVADNLEWFVLGLRKKNN